MDKTKLGEYFKSDKIVLVYKSIFLFIILLGVSSIKILDFSGIFGTAIIFVVSFTGFNVYLGISLYIVALLISDFTFTTIVFALLVVIGVVVYDILKDKKIVSRPIILLYFIFVLINISYISLYSDSLIDILSLILMAIFNVLYLYICINFFKPCKDRGFSINMNIDELICGGVLLITFIIGISHFSVRYFDIVTAISVFMLLVSTYTFSGSFTLFLGTLIGIGYSVAYINPIYISMFVLLSIASISFKSNYKIFSILAIILIDICFSIYFIDYYMFDWYVFISLIITGIIFQFTPLVVFSTIIDTLSIKGDKVILFDVVNMSKDSICRRIKEISSIFSRMDEVFRHMVQGNMSVTTAKMLAKEDVCNNLCSGCKDYSKCVSIRNEMTSDYLSAIIHTAFEKGKLSVLDVPKNVATICNVSRLISVVNKTIIDLKGYNDITTSMDSSRLLIASQLNGVSKLLYKLSEEINVNITFDVDREKRILEELSYKNILAYECVVYEKDMNTLIVNLIVSSKGYNKRYIERTISKCCNVKMMIVGVENSAIKDAVFVTLITAPNYDIVFGGASVGKNGLSVSGDNHTLIKIDDSRYLVAICDGMGSGAKADSVSDLTLTLIENYYKAGFDDDIILSSINKLLGLKDSDRYSTIDLCVMDLKNNDYSFIKLGASLSFIKGNKSTVEIEGSGLPIGVLDDIKPHIIKRKINEYDTLILCSDGVVDSFIKNDLKDYINSLDIINPQTMADSILERAIKNYGGFPKDDMTVVAVRIFPI